jgi:prevent-host-death family protein
MEQDMKQWPLQDAKAKFSEVVKLTKEGPQEITLRGKSAAVLMSRADYEKMVGRKPDLTSFLRKSPLAGLDIDIKRDKSLTRDVDL